MTARCIFNSQGLNWLEGAAQRLTIIKALMCFGFVFDDVQLEFYDDIFQTWDVIQIYSV